MDSGGGYKIQNKIALLFYTSKIHLTFFFQNEISIGMFCFVLQPVHVLKKKSESRDVLFMLAILDITTSPANLQHFPSRKKKDLLVPDAFNKELADLDLDGCQGIYKVE